ncbi:MAG: Zn-dependent exopeptidase M28 [Actinobacteria bacterium]|nr:Zn-dependent exopeptidase M28 [Actinomycetota bacterium]MBU4240013.1 Zn-dependent exopeptidase M28 [Actinomycetota bacterium]MBU4301719.1 Zn-dependent exopeptidase M28 [Actinomycetota bacterium]MBU4386762.1 Zn-dependent exopeptidase M28 [Actinomycetota bacterium]MCG2819713.1 M28 family metallopeptidase [Actinomycetes bacterium]
MHEHFDGHRAYNHIAKLAAHRRLPGTPGESIAQAYIRGAGEEIGVPMRSEEFTYSITPLTVFLPGVCLLLAAICLAGSFTYLWGDYLVMIPGLVLLLAIYLSFKWSGVFERFGAKGGDRRSLNLIGEINGEEPSGTIILSAHYDSKSQTMPVMVRAGLFMLGFGSAILLGFWLAVAGILEAAGISVLGNRAVFFVSLVPALFLFLLVFNLTGNKSPGALDNASGEAVILELARVLAMKPLRNFDVIVASFGCEEVGLCGSINYLLEHEEELRSRPCFMLNFDMPFSAAGRLFLNTGFELPPRFTSKRLNELAVKAAADKGLEIKGVYLPVGAAADHMPWVKHGFEATGFVSVATFIHRAGDSLDKINREGLRRAGEVALEVVRALDREYSPD